MSLFVQGQRWVVDSEPELGLGIVVDLDARSVTIFFPVADTERRYSIQQAPLTRISFASGDTIALQDGEACVAIVHEQSGLLIYELDGGDLVPETQISAEIQLNQPIMRLMMGQLNKASWFNFRRRLDGAMSRVWASGLNGLLGVKASLIPHQLYIADSACAHERVRVLLADEVGLGKTIEAGMILNRLLKLERISRALIVVPDALQVQWLVEMVRKFALTPSLYDTEGSDYSHGQIHIVPQSALVSQSDLILEAGFDLCIVDEAHHIKPETEDFGALRALSEHCPHMVLMTATPEQLGFESHFARLQLLDSEKFTDSKALLDQEKEYKSLNVLIRKLPESRNELIKAFDLEDSLSDDELTSRVLDCHGVGRVMFRNVRASISGFPRRRAVEHELNSDSWPERFEQLGQFLKANPLEKVLVIAHEKERVIDCENYLWAKHGIDSALFHEDMSLIERDRAAAYFADMEEGARVLLCSEIGSEGRNFQFSHHLFCLDLPEHPDLLEQRIGRLDRIGQAQDVNVHCFVAPSGESQIRWQWYHDVLDCVEQQNPAAGTVHDALWPEDAELVDDALMQKASERVDDLARQIGEGRDALLEMNSCREPQASELANSVATFEQQTPLELVEQASELLNFHFEELGSGRYSLIPADNMLIASLPGIPPEGVEVCFDRKIACQRDELTFLSWDAPFITGLWELLHHSELGSACVALLPSKQLPPGKCLLESCFDFVIQSEWAAQCLPFIENSSIRTLGLENGESDLASVLREDQLQASIKSADKRLARQIVLSKKDELSSWYTRTEQFAEAAKEKLVEKAQASIREHFDREISRLAVLANKNPAIDSADVQELEDKQKALLAALHNNVQLNLSAVRLIVTIEP